MPSRRRPVHEQSIPPPAKANAYRFVVKWLVAGGILFAALAGGIYTGLSATPHRAQTTPESLQHPALLDLGDRFPDYELVDPVAHTRTTVAALTAEGPVLLLFVSESCNICRNLGRYWRKKVVPALRDDIQLALVFDVGDWSGTLDSTGDLFLPGARIFTTDREAQRGDDGIVGTPILVGLGTDSRIRFISPGFNREVGSEFINAYL